MLRSLSVLVMELSPTLRSRFEAGVGPGTTCPQEWQGCTTSGGYGQISIASGTSRGAHVVRWFLEHGWWPRAILHSCDNRRCVTLAHLSEGTKGDNNRDTARKRRYHYGTNHHNGKLSDTMVSEIRQRREAGAKLKTLADEYGVSQALISQIALGRARLDPGQTS